MTPATAMADMIIVYVYEHGSPDVRAKMEAIEDEREMLDYARIELTRLFVRAEQKP